MVPAVPQVLEPLKGVDQLRAEHTLQQDATSLAVAVLAGKRPAVRDDEVCRTVEEGAEGAYAGGGAEIEVDADVDAGLAKMAVVRGGVAEFAEQLVKGAQIRAEALRRDGVVLPTFGAGHLAGHDGGRAQAVFAHLPQALLIGYVLKDLSMDSRRERCREAARLPV